MERYFLDGEVEEGLPDHRAIMRLELWQCCEGGSREGGQRE